jgi:hypothetical protein
MGPLSSLERYRFDLHGFVVRRGVLAAGELEQLHREIDALHLPPAADTITSQRFSGLLEAGGLLRDLMDHAAVIDVVRELCGDEVRLDHAYGIVMAPGTTGLGLHGGSLPFDPAQFYEIKGGRMHCGLVAVQWALVDHPAESGGFACVPGAHRAAFELPEGVDLEHDLVETVQMRAGDLVVFTEALTHGTRRWTGSGDRRTVLYKYSPGNSSWSDRPACEPSVVPLLSERQQRLCQGPAVAYHRPV